jgi:TPR repeat protein
MSLADVTPDPTLEHREYIALHFRELERRNDAESLFERGIRLRNGIGLPANEKLGWDFTIRAARLGHPVALANCLHLGRGTEKNEILAVALYHESAGRNHPGGNDTRTSFSVC